MNLKNPQTNAWLPRFKPITQKYVTTIIDQLPQPTVFYFDRANPAALTLANKCRNQGGLVIFEPSSIKDETLFLKALSVSHIVKFSKERIPYYQDLYPNSQVPLEIQTLGDNGIAFRSTQSGATWHHLPAYSIKGVVDTAGAGDWCTAGIVHTLLTKEQVFEEITHSDIERAIKFGQSLGALNCCFLGARGSMYAMSATQLGEVASDLIKNELKTQLFDVALPNINAQKRPSYIDYEELLYRQSVKTT